MSFKLVHGLKWEYLSQTEKWGQKEGEKGEKTQTHYPSIF